MINGMIEKSDLENKYVFWDIDGTLAAYRFNGHVADSEGTDNGMSIKEIDDKHIWLDRNYPMIKDRILVFESFSKADCIIEYCKKSSIELKDTIYVDDIIKYLREAERKGIESWHISSFLDWQFYNER